MFGADKASIFWRAEPQQKCRAHLHGLICRGNIFDRCNRKKGRIIVKGEQRVVQKLQN